MSQVKKFSAAAIGASLATIAVWLSDAFAGVKVPPEVATAFGGLITYLASFLIPDDVEE